MDNRGEHRNYNEKLELREKGRVRKYTKGLLGREDLEELARATWGEDTRLRIDALDVEKNPFIARVITEKEETGIFLNIEERRFVYRRSDTQEIVAESLPGLVEDHEMLESVSRETKVVKSRPPFLYPQLMGVDYDELFPREKKVAIIGDPYMACDFENGTIVEYEFGEEIMPNFAHVIVSGGNEHVSIFNVASSFYEYVDREDMDALGRIGHVLERPNNAEREGNPYWHTIHDLHMLIGTCGEIAEGVVSGLISEEQLADDVEVLARERLISLHKKVKDLVEGTWLRADYEQEIQTDDERAILDFFFHLKQRSRDNKGRAMEWKRYKDTWNNYLQNIPLERIKQDIPDIERKIAGVHHWLEVLPETDARARIREGLRRLEDFYFSIVDWGQRNLEGEWWNVQNQIRDSVIEDTKNIGMMSDGVFGIDIPGSALPRRVEEFLLRTERRAENVITYIEEILPKLLGEMNRIKQSAPGMNEETLYRYIKSHERALIKSFIPVPRPKRAVAIRGFFPDAVDIDKQDRIVALTSVTMHGWNRLNQEGFRKNIEDALVFLNDGGKYILGPVNQEVYFGHPQGIFDCEGLTRALQELRKEGKIDFSFVKGVREYGGWSDDTEKDVEFSSEVDVLASGEAAKSLIITRR